MITMDSVLNDARSKCNRLEYKDDRSERINVTSFIARCSGYDVNDMLSSPSSHNVHYNRVRSQDNNNNNLRALESNNKLPKYSTRSLYSSPALDYNETNSIASDTRSLDSLTKSIPVCGNAQSLRCGGDLQGETIGDLERSQITSAMINRRNDGDDISLPAWTSPLNTSAASTIFVPLTPPVDRSLTGSPSFKYNTHDLNLHSELLQATAAGWWLAHKGFHQPWGSGTMVTNDPKPEPKRPTVRPIPEYTVPQMTSTVISTSASSMMTMKCFECSFATLDKTEISAHYTNAHGHKLANQSTLPLPSERSNMVGDEKVTYNKRKGSAPACLSDITCSNHSSADVQSHPGLADGYYSITKAFPSHRRSLTTLGTVFSKASDVTSNELQCFECTFTTVSKGAMISHYNTAHASLWSTYNCFLCDKSAESRPEIADHIYQEHFCGDGRSKSKNLLPVSNVKRSNYLKATKQRYKPLNKLKSSSYIHKYPKYRQDNKHIIKFIKPHRREYPNADESNRNCGIIDTDIDVQYKNQPKLEMLYMKLKSMFESPENMKLGSDSVTHNKDCDMMYIDNFIGRLMRNDKNVTNRSSDVTTQTNIVFGNQNVEIVVNFNKNPEVEGRIRYFFDEKEIHPTYNDNSDIDSHFIKKNYATTNEIFTLQNYLKHHSNSISLKSFRTLKTKVASYLKVRKYFIHQILTPKLLLGNPRRLHRFSNNALSASVRGDNEEEELKSNGIHLEASNSTRTVITESEIVAGDEVDSALEIVSPRDGSHSPNVHFYCPTFSFVKAITWTHDRNKKVLASPNQSLDIGCVSDKDSIDASSGKVSHSGDNRSNSLTPSPILFSEITNYDHNNESVSIDHYVGSSTTMGQDGATKEYVGMNGTELEVTHKLYICPLRFDRNCSFKTRNKKRWADHMDHHNGLKNHTCKLCSYKTTWYENLNQHSKRMHPGCLRLADTSFPAHPLRDNSSVITRYEDKTEIRGNDVHNEMSKQMDSHMGGGVSKLNKRKSAPLKFVGRGNKFSRVISYHPNQDLIQDSKLTLSKSKFINPIRLSDSKAMTSSFPRQGRLRHSTYPPANVRSSVHYKHYMSSLHDIDPSQTRTFSKDAIAGIAYPKSDDYPKSSTSLATLLHITAQERLTTSELTIGNGLLKPQETLTSLAKGNHRCLSPPPLGNEVEDEKIAKAIKFMIKMSVDNKLPASQRYFSQSLTHPNSQSGYIPSYTPKSDILEDRITVKDNDGDLGKAVYDDTKDSQNNGTNKTRERKLKNKRVTPTSDFNGIDRLAAAGMFYQEYMKRMGVDIGSAHDSTKHSLTDAGLPWNTMPPYISPSYNHRSPHHEMLGFGSENGWPSVPLNQFTLPFAPLPQGMEGVPFPTMCTLCGTYFNSFPDLAIHYEAVHEILIPPLPTRDQLRYGGFDHTKYFNGTDRDKKYKSGECSPEVSDIMGEGIKHSRMGPVEHPEGEFNWPSIPFHGNMMSQAPFNMAAMIALYANPENRHYYAKMMMDPEHKSLKTKRKSSAESHESGASSGKRATKERHKTSTSGSYVKNNYIKDHLRYMNARKNSLNSDNASEASSKHVFNEESTEIENLIDPSQHISHDQRLAHNKSFQNPLDDFDGKLVQGKSVSDKSNILDFTDSDQGIHYSDPQSFKPFPRPSTNPMAESDTFSHQMISPITCCDTSKTVTSHVTTHHRTGGNGLYCSAAANYLPTPESLLLVMSHAGSKHNSNNASSPHLDFAGPRVADHHNSLEGTILPGGLGPYDPHDPVHQQYLMRLGAAGGPNSKRQRTHRCTLPGCNFEAYDKNRMLDHLAAHRGEKPHGCPYCEFRTSWRFNIKNHIRSKHPNML